MDEAELKEFSRLCREELDNVKDSIIRLLPENLHRQASFSSDNFVQIVAHHFYNLGNRGDQAESESKRLQARLTQVSQENESLKKEMEGAIFPFIKRPPIQFAGDERPVLDIPEQLSPEERLTDILEALRPYLGVMGQAEHFTLRIQSAHSRDLLWPCYQLLRKKHPKSTRWNKDSSNGQAAIDADGMTTLQSLEKWHIDRVIIESLENQ